MMKSITIGCLLSAFLVSVDPSPYQSRVNDFIAVHENIVTSSITRFHLTYQLEKDSSFIWKDGYSIDLGKFDGEVAFYEYKDSSHCSSALNVLLMNFPTEGGTLTRNVNVKAFKITPSVFVITDKTISVFGAACESDTMKYSRLKADFLKIFADSSSQVIDCGCGGPIIWK